MSLVQYAAAANDPATLQGRSQLFKTAMRRVASTVCVLTTEHMGRRWGLTATAVCSLSAAPPSLIACVNRDAEAHEAISQSRRICINVLSEDQIEIAQRFSGTLGHRGEQRFEGAEWYLLATGAPVLRHAAATFDCTIFDRSTYHTHSVLTCFAQAISLGDAGNPLIYADRNYGGVRGIAPAAA
jgi:flavin reductase (DIM6/NTAB) family NADH-FMN oxidoreductase RutF